MLGMTGAGLLRNSSADDEIPKAPVPADETLLVKAGLVTDCHYADKDAAMNRYYRESVSKLEAAVSTFRDSGVHFVLQNGDLIDGANRARDYIKSMNSVLVQSKIPTHHVLGNHDMESISKPEFLQTVAAAASYYSFEQGGMHFIVLDACYREDNVSYAPGIYDWQNTTIPPLQLEWLRADLTSTQKPTIVFVHHRLDLADDNVYAPASSAKTRRILEESGKVRAVIQGHSHDSTYASINGIHYCTLRALVEGSGAANNAYAILNVFKDGTIRLDGFGAQHTRNLAIA